MSGKSGHYKMNKYEEALEIVDCKMHADDWFCEIEKRSSKECAKCDCTKAYETLKELVEKATQKKPIPLNWDMNRCPNCKCYLPTKRNALKKREPRIYCDRCGQAIDWSEE